MIFFFKTLKEYYMIIYAIFGDIGPAKEGVMALRVLESRGHAVRYFVDWSPQAKAGTDILTKLGIAYETRQPKADDRPDLIFIGASAGTAIAAQNDWTRFGQELVAGKPRCPVLWLEDIYGAAERREAVSSPNVLCVCDDLAKRIALAVRPLLDVRVCGKPTFSGKVSGVVQNKAAIRARLRTSLNISDDEFLLIYWSGGQYPTRVEAHLKALERVSSAAARSVVMAIRFHPKLSEREKERFSKTVERFSARRVDTALLDPDEAITAADVNLCEFGSNTSYVSALCALPTVITTFPECRALLQNIGYPNGITPLAFANAGWEANSAEELIALLERIASDKDTAHRYVEEGARAFASLLAPGAPERIALVAEECMRR